ncbi:MAG: FadR/GntR family transcriptional regulator [Sciscionella sp.]
MAEEQDRGSRFQRVGSGRNLNKIVVVLRGSILRGELKPGEQLPAEPELAKQLGVSRPMLREALKALEMSGYLVVRRGYGGGTFVTAPDPMEFHSIQAAPLSSLDVTAKDVLHARLAIEPAAARLTAENGSGMEASRFLRQLAAAHVRPAYVVNGIVDFHVAIVEAARNQVFTAVIRSLRGAIAVDLNTRVQDRQWYVECRDGLAHLLERVDTRDGAGAEKAMRHHLLEHENFHGIAHGWR